MQDRIELLGMAFFGFHGCLPEERGEGQKFLVDAVLYLDMQKAGKTDDLSHTVNYAAVFDSIRSIVEGAPRNLIERVAEEIASRILAEYPLQRIEVAVHKPMAPIGGDFQDVCVRIERSRT